MTNIHVQIAYDSASKQQKQRESDQIAKDIQRFKKRGGKIEVLGDTDFSQSPASYKIIGSGFERGVRKDDQ